MPREIRIRVAEDEVERLDEAAEVMYGESAAEDIPRGKVIGELAHDYIIREGGDDERPR